MRHFYHLYCGAPWEVIANSHLQALRDTGQRWDVTVGLIGSAEARTEARTLFKGELQRVDFIEADQGWEQVTLGVLHRWAKTAAPATPVLYAHSKGVTHKGGAGTPLAGLQGTVWRESMTRHVIGRWQECVDLLAEHDAVGCHWLTPEEYPGVVEVPFFGGNFWWANAGYLAALPTVSGATRYHAEGWIGLSDPKVYDMRPGWPNFGLFAEDVVTLLNPALVAH